MLMGSVSAGDSRPQQGGLWDWGLLGLPSGSRHVGDRHKDYLAWLLAPLSRGMSDGAIFTNWGPPSPFSSCLSCCLAHGGWGGPHGGMGMRFTCVSLSYSFLFPHIFDVESLLQGSTPVLWSRNYRTFGKVQSDNQTPLKGNYSWLSV